MVRFISIPFFLLFMVAVWSGGGLAATTSFPSLDLSKFEMTQRELTPYNDALNRIGMDGVIVCRFVNEEDRQDIYFQCPVYHNEQFGLAPLPIGSNDEMIISIYLGPDEYDLWRVTWQSNWEVEWACHQHLAASVMDVSERIYPDPDQVHALAMWCVVKMNETPFVQGPET